MRGTLIVLCAALALGACGRGERADGARKPSVEYEAGSEEISRVGPAQIGVRSSERWGEYLVDGVGRPLYVFSRDSPRSASECDRACARAWPALLTRGRAQGIAPELSRSLIGATRRGDAHQATYAGRPLYLYAADGLGNPRGDGIRAYGGRFFLARPDGVMHESRGRRARR